MQISKAVRWLVAAALLAVGCGLPEGEFFGQVDDDPDPTHLRWCNSGEPEYLDPALVTDTTGLPLSYAMFDGLTRHNMQGLPEPSIATHWDIDADQRTFTFHLHDKARWSNGRPITAHDFAYHIVRILHPLTGSRNAYHHARLKNAELYTANRVRVVMRDSPPFAAGDLVELVSGAGEEGKDLTRLLELIAEHRQAEEGEAATLHEGIINILNLADLWKVDLEAAMRRELRSLPLPDSNRRTSDRPLALRDLGAGEGEAYATVPPEREVTIVELAEHGGGEWAYVHWDYRDGVYGWVPAEQLTGQPNGEIAYTVRAVPRKHVPGLPLRDEVEAPAAPGEDAGEIEPEAPPTLALPPEAGGEDLAETEVAEAEAEAEAETETETAETETETETAAEPALREGVVKGADLLMLPEAVGVRAVDDRTLVLETADPVPFLIDMTAGRFFRASPREAVSRWPRRWTLPEHIITSGAFHMKDWKQRDYILLERSDTYWNRASVKLERITAYSMNNQAANANYYFQGSCDAITSNNVPASYLPVLGGTRGRGEAYPDFYSAPYLGIYFLLINNEKYDNVHFRRALNYSFDRRPLPHFLHGGQIPTARYVPGMPNDLLSEEDRELCGVTADTPGTSTVMIAGELCYVPPPGLDFDPEKARAELALAKEQMGDDFPRRLTFKFNTGVEGHKLVAEYAQDVWQRHLGLRVDLESQEWKTYLKDTADGEYDIARMGWIGSFPEPEENFLKNFRCDSPDNRARFCNEEFEHHMRLAASTADRAQRIVHARDAERVMLENAAVIPLYVYTQQHLQKPYVRDLAINPVDQVPLERAWIDPDWKKNGVKPIGERFR